MGGINGENKKKQLKLDLPFVKGDQTGYLITDGDEGILSFTEKVLSLSENEKLNVTVKPNGGFVMVVD